jgi:hypothetical protein
MEGKKDSDIGRTAVIDTEREGCTSMFSTFWLNANIEFK